MEETRNIHHTQMAVFRMRQFDLQNVVREAFIELDKPMSLYRRKTHTFRSLCQKSAMILSYK